MRRSSKLTRELKKKKCFKQFLISVEGSVTEKEYFRGLKKLSRNISINYIGRKSGQSSPKAVLNKIREYLLDYRGKNYEAWVVVDRDRWKEEHLDALLDWSKTSLKNNMALTNPKFEFWLLLHYIDGKKSKTPKAIVGRLKQFIPSYEKHVCQLVSSHNFLQMVTDAINRAKLYDTPPCKGWPRKRGSTVYKLAESILENVGLIKINKKKKK